MNLKQTECVGVVQREGDVGTVQVAAGLGDVHVAILVERGRGREDMVAVQGVAGLQVAADREVLRLPLHLVATERQRGGEVEVVSLQETAAGGERGDVAAVLGLVALGLLVVQREGEGHGPRLDGQTVAGAKGDGGDIADARGVGVQVLVGTETEGEAGGMAESLAVEVG